jgi:hypothetical protein
LYNGGPLLGQGYTVKDNDTTRRILFQWVTPMRAASSLSSTWNGGTPGSQYISTLSGQIYTTGISAGTEYGFSEVIADSEL